MFVSSLTLSLWAARPICTAIPSSDTPLTTQPALLPSIARKSRGIASSALALDNSHATAVVLASKAVTLALLSYG